MNVEETAIKIEIILTVPSLITRVDAIQATEGSDLALCIAMIRDKMEQLERNAREGKLVAVYATNDLTACKQTVNFLEQQAKVV